MADPLPGSKASSSVAGQRTSSNGQVSLQDSKLTQFFSKKPAQGNKPLDPAMQRAIPMIKQSEPRPASQTTTTNPTTTAATHSQDGASRSSAENDAAAADREDCVDLSVAAHREEVKKDILSNPVIQANKRTRTDESQGSFLQGAAAGSSMAHHAALNHDEQMARRMQQKMPVVPAIDQQGSDEDDEEAENVEGDDDDDEMLPMRRRNRQIKDSDYGAEVADHDASSSEEMHDDLEPENIYDEQEEADKKKKASSRQPVSRRHRTDIDEANLEDDEQEETVFIDNLPNDESGIRTMLRDVKHHIAKLEQQFLREEDSDAEEDEQLLSSLKQVDTAGCIEDDERQRQSYLDNRQFWCVPILTDVMNFNWDKLAVAQQRHGGRLFDIITMDPPWQLSSANPTRGVAIAYSTLNDDNIMKIPVEKIQKDGLLLIWVINNKFKFALDFFKKHGYKQCDEIVWVKQTVNGKINKGHGYYLQHAKETCLVGYKGDLGERLKNNVDCDTIFSMRRGQSQKPEEIYEICESLCPQGYFLEIFGRRNNLHDGWVTIGNEL